jgi:hypothetical protein
MKVETRGQLQLSGPLSRNDALRSLSSGDVVEVRLLEMKGRLSALVDLKGNKVELHFTSPPQKADTFYLEFVKVKGDILQFKLLSEKIDISDILRYTNIGSGSVPVDKLGNLSKNILSTLPGLFSLNLLLSGVFDSRKGRDLAGFMRFLTAKGLPISDVPFASALLSGMKSEQAYLMSELCKQTGISFDAELDRQIDSEYTAGDAPIALDETFMSKNGPYTIVIPHENDFKSIELLGGQDSFCGRLELPAIGNIEFFVRMGSTLEALIVCQDSVIDMIREKIEDVQKSLKRHYGKAEIRVLSDLVMRKKILAFAQGLDNRSLDVFA